MLRKGRGEQRIAKIVDSPCLPESNLFCSQESMLFIGIVAMLVVKPSQNRYIKNLPFCCMELTESFK